MRERGLCQGNVHNKHDQVGVLLAYFPKGVDRTSHFFSLSPNVPACMHSHSTTYCFQFGTVRNNVAYECFYKYISVSLWIPGIELGWGSTWAVRFASLWGDSAK